MVCADVLDRLSPFLDDELDPVASREMARHLESCSSCAAAVGRQRELRETLRRDLEYHRAPDLLQARIMRDARAAVQRDGGLSRGAPRPWRWLSAAAAVVAVAGRAWLFATLSRGRAGDLTAREAVAGPGRSPVANPLAGHPPTGQPTGKPWV